MPISPATEDQAQHIDAQISHYFDLIRDLRSQRNALMPISQLPTEILCEIFMEVRGDSDLSKYKNYWFWTKTSFSEPSLEWIAVSHVSRHWRDTAIQEPRLWADPPLSNSKWAMIMLERSCMAPLPAITMNVPEFGEGVLPALGPHLPRISSLVIPEMSPMALRKVLPLLPLSTPELETLSVNCWTKSSAIKNQKIWRHLPFSARIEAVTFPDNALHDTPKLRRLELRGIVISWTSTLFAHLTVLSISAVPDYSKPTPTQLVTILGSAPGLTRLHLADVCPSIETQLFEGLPMQLLIHSLQHLSLRGTLPQLRLFFAIVAAPGLQGCSITMRYSKNAAVHLPRLFLSMTRSFNVPNIIGSGADVRKMKLGHFTECDLYSQASKLLSSERTEEPDKERTRPDYYQWVGIWDKIDRRCLTMEIAICSEDDEDGEMQDDDGRAEIMNEQTSTIISHLFQSFDWSGLSGLDISCLEYGEPQMFASTFGTITELRVITLDEWFFSAIDSFPDLYPMNHLAPEKPSFPGLTDINICRSQIMSQKSIETLAKCLQQRHANGTPIVSVNMHHGYLAMHKILLLKPYAQHVIARTGDPSDWN